MERPSLTYPGGETVLIVLADKNFEMKVQKQKLGNLSGEESKGIKG